MYKKLVYISLYCLFFVSPAPSSSQYNSLLTLPKLSQIFSPCGEANTIAPGENISCSEALPLINTALSNYNLNSAEQVAFYLSVVQVESGNLSFNKNHYPGRPGQGTRSMMMPINLYSFAKEVSDPRLQSLTSKPYNDNNNDAKAQLLNILMDNQFSFLPGAWWIAKGAAILQNQSCKSLASDLVGADQAKVASLFSTCLGVDGSSRVASYTSILNILNA